jgi:hemoglobin
MQNKASKAIGLLAATALVSALAIGSSLAQSESGKASLYTRLGGIHKIASLIDMDFDMAVKSKVLLKNPRFVQAMKSTPTPAVKFLVTNFIAANTGGPQIQPDMSKVAGVYKWLNFSPEEVAELNKIDAVSVKKLGIDPAAAMELQMWLKKQIDMAEPMEPGMENLMDKESLYARLGGFMPLSVVVDTFVNRLATDKVLLANPNTVKSLTSGKVSAAGLKYLVTEQLAMAAGGPWKYSGKTMKDSHKDLMISEKEWEAAAKILGEVLNMYKVPEKEQKEVFAAVGATKKDIVKG